MNHRLHQATDNHGIYNRTDITGNGHRNEHGNGHGNGHCDGNGKGNIKKKSREKVATWNVTGIGDHIPEIVEIMKKRKLPCQEYRTAERKDLDQNRLTATCIYMEWKRHTCRSWSRLHS